VIYKLVVCAEEVKNVLDCVLILVTGSDSDFMYYCYIHRCYLKLGQWQESLHGINELTIPAVLQYYATATDHDATWYKAWHAWAYMNFETVLFYKHQQQQQQQQQQQSEAGGTSNRAQADANPASRAGLVSFTNFIQMCVT
jgi:hypothetical protein